jgi:GH15 family glucan-1,4-alpha-glucosidase
MRRLLVAVLLGATVGADAQTILLPDRWLFRTGDDSAYALPAFHDAGWGTIEVPAWWEKEGFDNYDGYAWYRVHFTADAASIGREMILQLGRIDDCDEAFLNGRKIGSSGTMPPDPVTAWNRQRVYNIPSGVIARDNVLAVRVFDMMGAGGLVEGPIGIWTPAEFAAEMTAPAVPRHSFHELTTSNGLIAAVFDERRGYVTAVRPHIFQAYDSARMVRPFALNVGPVPTQERFVSDYRQHTHVISARRGRLTVDYFAPFTTGEKVLYVAVTGPKGEVQRAPVTYRPSASGAVVLVDSADFIRPGGEMRKYYMFGFTDMLHRDPTVVSRAKHRLMNGEGGLVEEEVAAMRRVIESARFPAGLTAAERAVMEQSVAVLKMAQVSDLEIFSRSHGQILASLPPGEWNIAWVRDGMYSTMGLTRIGMYAEAKKMLRFCLDAQSGHYVHHRHTDSLDYGIGVPYQISVCRYFGTGKEESDFTDAGGPNVEIDGFGLFLTAFSDYVRRSGDTEFLHDRYEEIVRRVADPIIHCTDSTGLIRRDSGPWERHLPGKQFAYTSIACAAGLRDLARLCAKEHLAGADRFQAGAQRLIDGIRRRCLADGTVIKGNAEAADPALYDYYDGGTIEAFSLGLLDDPALFASHTEAYEKALRIPGERRGFGRINRGDAYETAEWILLDLRWATAMQRFGDARGARALLDWVTQHAAMNFNLLPEILNERTAAYGGAIPMVGFGPGAYILAVDAIVRN